MANYQQYPTPPPTSSPKHAQAFQSYEYPAPSSFTQPPNTNPQLNGSVPPKIPAQDSYFHSYSAPGSPVHSSGNSTFQQPPKPSPYPRRRSSPLFSGPGGIQYTQPSARPFSPPKYGPPRPFSPTGLHRTSPRPLHFSPVNPVPSPYSAGRPQPRPGFLRRIAQKLEQWIKAFMRWSKEHPMIAGLLTFVPVMTVAGIVKIARVMGKWFGFLDKGFGKPGKGDKGIGGGEWGWGLEDFKGFAGSKGGPFEGLLKIAHMLVNHYCKLTPSAVPRVASILMELYFLDVKK